VKEPRSSGIRFRGLIITPDSILVFTFYFFVRF
jgi:hypothetical protein